MQLLKLLAISLVAGISACTNTGTEKNGPFKNALSYNDYIAQKQAAIQHLTLQFSRQSKSDFMKADSTISQAVALTERNIRELKTMPDWKGDTTLRNSAIRLFQFYQQCFATDFKRILIIQKDGILTPAELEEYSQLTNRLNSTQRQLDSAMGASQTVFAEKNGFNKKESVSPSPSSAGK